MSLEDEVRKNLEQQCPIAEDVDSPLGINIRRTARRFGAKVGLVKHPTAQAIGDIRRGKVGDNDYTKPPKRRK